jgi:UDP-N-acetyl-D-galactosamine dehydrogenase
MRNTKIVSIKEHLTEYNCRVDVTDPFANKSEAKKLFDIDLIEFDLISGYDAVILAVKHDKYLQLSKSMWNKIVKKNGVLIDVKSAITKKMFSKNDISHWRL